MKSLGADNVIDYFIPHRARLDYSDFPVDLDARWLRKATLDEFVIHETCVPAMGEGAAVQTIRDYTVRRLTMRMISREEKKE